MCTSDYGISSVKFSLLVFWTYLQVASCNLKLIRQLAHRQFWNEPQTTQYLSTNANQSPCPNIFEYRYDESGRLFGFLEVGVPNSKIMDLEVQFCVGNRVDKGKEGSISLPYLNNQQIINNIQQRRPLNYKINFPVWRGPQPKITKIAVNGNILCSGQPYTLDSVPILTTINLRHKLQVNTLPLVSSLPNQENNQNSFQIDAGNIYNIDYGTNPNLDVRNDNVNNVGGNPYNFKPNSPKTVPEIVFKPDIPRNNDEMYSRNPFFNRISTTGSPYVNNGRNPFNYQFGSNPPTTERIFPSLSSPVDTTQKPLWRPDVNNEPKIRDTTSQFLNDVCGRPIVTNSLVFKGQSVPSGAFPWLVAIFRTTSSGLEYHCSGTLISKRHVVTAAHCVKPDSYVLSPDKIVLVMGRMNIQSWGTTDVERIMNAEQLFVNPNYSTSSADADICVIVLKGDIIFSKFIRPICLWADDTDLSLVVGKKGIVVGWGRDENGLKVSPEPRQIELPIVSHAQCLWSNHTFADITSENTFCAGDRSGSGPCNGDSGSGFVMQINERWYLRGIVSMSLSDPYTRTCDLSNYVVFTDASKYANWLLSVVK